MSDDNDPDEYLTPLENELLTENKLLRKQIIDFKSQDTAMIADQDQLSYNHKEVKWEPIEDGLYARNDKKLKEELIDARERLANADVVNVSDFVVCKKVLINSGKYLQTVFGKSYTEHINKGMECLCHDKCYYEDEKG